MKCKVIVTLKNLDAAKALKSRIEDMQDNDVPVMVGQIGRHITKVKVEHLMSTEKELEDHEGDDE